MANDPTPPFTKDAMASELREILCIQASQIAHCASDEAATVFLGFSCRLGPADSPPPGMIEQIDLARFPAWTYMSTAYDYAFQAGQCWGYGESNNHDLVAFAEGITPAASYGDRSPYLDSNSKCRHVVDLAIGRWSLDIDDGRKLTVRQLALLANMSEAAVRNSLSAEKIRSPVDRDPALAWLTGRKGFVATRTEENRQAFWAVHTRNLLDGPRFEAGLRSILLDLSLTVEATAQRAGVNAEIIRGLLGERPFQADVDDLKKVGSVLDVDVPRFVGQAIEAGLRRSG